MEDLLNLEVDKCCGWGLVGVGMKMWEVVALEGSECQVERVHPMGSTMNIFGICSAKGDIRHREEQMSGADERWPGISSKSIGFLYFTIVIITTWWHFHADLHYNIKRKSQALNKISGNKLKSHTCLYSPILPLRLFISIIFSFFLPRY